MLRHYVQALNQKHHSIRRLDDRGGERGSARLSSLVREEERERESKKEKKNGKKRKRATISGQHSNCIKSNTSKTSERLS